MRRRDDPELCASCCPSPTRNSGGRAALLYSLCSVDFFFGSDIGFGSVLCSTSLASMPSSPVASGGAFGYSAERLDGCTADELKLLVKARGLPWPDRNDPARAARGRSVGSGLVKADFIAALMTPDGSAAPGPGPGPPVHHDAPRCAATSLLLRSCTVVLTIKRWDAPRPVSLTRGFKGHTPFIRPVFETASAASCLCHQVRLGLLAKSRALSETF